MSPVRLLWTGGWDSTFRLVDLVRQGREVQPYYVFSDERPTAVEENRAMRAIRARVTAKWPEAARLIRPTIEGEKVRLRPDPQVAAWHAALRTRCCVGPQYEWLERFAREQGIGRLELGATRDDRNFLAMLGGHLVRGTDDDPGAYRLAMPPACEELRLFERYDFPLLDTRKRDMARLAAEGGFSDVLDLTWFCYEPREGRPCGFCVPCRATLEAGMSERVPAPSLVARLRHGGRLGWMRARALTPAPVLRVLRAMRRRVG